MLGVAKASRRLRLRIVVGDRTRSTDQDRVLGLSPAFRSAVHAGTMPRLAGTDPSPVAFDNGQFRGARGTYCKGVISLGISVATLGQFGTDVMHNSLDRLGGDPLTAYLRHDDGRPMERACLSSSHDDPLYQERGQFSSVKTQHFPQGEKSPGGTWGNERPARRRSQYRRPR